MKLPGKVNSRHCDQQLHDIAPARVRRTAAQPAAGLAAFEPAEPGLWLPVGGLGSATIGFLAALNGEVPPPDTATGILTFAVVGCVLGVVSMRDQIAGRMMASGAVILSVLAVLALIGSYRPALFSALLS